MPGCFRFVGVEKLKDSNRLKNKYMRLFLVFIILLNLLYAAWEFLNPSVTNNDIPPLPDNLQTLELLGEEKRGGALVGENSGLVQEASVSNGLDDGQESLSAQAQTDEAGINKSQVTDQVVNIDESVKACFTLGPFKDSEIMQQLRISLSEHVEGMKVRKLRDSEKHRYWVYIPSKGSRAMARKTVEALRAKGVKDFYIILNGETKNGVSLGHFKEPRHANRRYKKVKGLGFDAEIKVIYRDYDVYWLDYEIGPSSVGDSFSIDEYLTEGVSQLKRDC